MRKKSPQYEWSSYLNYVRALIFDHTINREKFKGVGILRAPIKQKNIMQRITSFLFITLHKVHLWDGHFWDDMWFWKYWRL